MRHEFNQTPISTIISQLLLGLAVTMPAAAATIDDSVINSTITNTGEDLHYTAKDIRINPSTGSSAIAASGGNGTTYIGGSETETITIGSGSNYSIYLVAQGGQPTHAELKARDKISINSSKWGIQVVNATQSVPPPADRTSLKIEAKEVEISAAKTALYAYSNSKTEIEGDLIKIERRDIQSNNFKEVIEVRGNSTLVINADKKGTVIIDGDIMFATPYYEGAGNQNGNLINGDVTLNLTGSDSLWTGCAIKSYKPNAQPGESMNVDYGFETNEHVGPVTDFKVLISEGAVWNMNHASYVSRMNLETGGTINVEPQASEANFEQLTLNDGVINLQGGAEQKLESRITNGRGTVNLASVREGDGLAAPRVKMTGGDEGAQIAFNLEGLTSDDVADPAAALRSVHGNIEVTDLNGTLVLKGGDVRGDYVVGFAPDGSAGAVESKANPKLVAYGGIHALGAVQWRHQTDSLLKRMGELRDAAGTVGAWARLYGSEQKYGERSIKARNTTIEAGADVDVGAGWKTGASFSYTDGDADAENGTGKSDMYGVALYGTWLGDDGAFVDLIAKYARLSNDFTAADMKGGFDNNAWSVSAELGRRVLLGETAFVEPAAALTYGRIMGDDFTASNSVKVEQDDYETLIGRIGIRGGFFFPKAKGSIYARAALLHDFMGEAESTASKMNDGLLVTERLKDELGGTWVEYGLGANLKLSDTAYAYVDLERTSGSEVTESWRWTAGLRKAF